MHIMHRAANGNGRAALQLYQKFFLNRHMLNLKCLNDFGKMVHSSLALMEGLEQELYDIQTWKKPS